MPSGGPHHRYRDEVREIIKLQLEAGIPGKVIAHYNKVSPSFVSQMNVERKIHPEVLEACRRKKGPKALISPEANAALAKFMEKNPNALRSEAVELLRDKFDIDVSESTVSRAMKRLRLARKDLRGGVDQRVAVDDESAADANERSGDA